MKCDFCGHEVAPGTVECPYCHYQFKIDAQVLSPEERDTFEGVTIDESAGTEETKSAREGAVYDSGADAYNERQQQVPPNIKVHTFGCGSGILSITALRLGAESAVGVDIDPKAEDIARENAAYNGFSAPAFTALTGNVTADKGLMERLSQKEYGLVLVNIVADVIIGLAPVLPHFLNESSTLICSGILDTRLSDVLDALTAAGLTVTATKAKDDWRCVTAIRKYI